MTLGSLPLGLSVKTRLHSPLYRVRNIYTLMEKPSATKKDTLVIKPGNTRQKGRRSAPKAEERMTGKLDPYTYTLKDKRVGELRVLSSSRAWWEGQDGQVKLHRLIDAYCWHYTDAQACSHADITMIQLTYFQKLHPDFYEIKARAKQQIGMHAKVRIGKAIESGENGTKDAWEWLEKTERETFGRNIDVTSQGEKITPQHNVIQFVNFESKEIIHAEEEHVEISEESTNDEPHAENQ